MGIDEVKDSDKLVNSCRNIARDTSESEYSMAREGGVKTEIVNNGNSVDYN